MYICVYIYIYIYIYICIRLARNACMTATCEHLVVAKHVDAYGRLRLLPVIIYIYIYIYTIHISYVRTHSGYQESVQEAHEECPLMSDNIQTIVTL